MSQTAKQLNKGEKLDFETVDHDSRFSLETVT